METPTSVAAAVGGMSAANIPVTFTAAEGEALDRLRSRYQQSGDTLGERELARLRFLRWLYLSGRLVP
jgi:hypothetical protein